MSLHTIKHFSRPMILAAAAVILHISTATAADSTADTQQQMGVLLAGSPGAHSASQSAPRDNITSADAQELARQVLLGTTGSPVRATDTIETAAVALVSRKTEPQVPPVLYGDRQASTVRQVLLGQHPASDAS
jgi:hypothetical protein